VRNDVFANMLTIVNSVTYFTVENVLHENLGRHVSRVQRLEIWHWIQFYTF